MEAREKLSPAERSELDKPLNDAAVGGDTDKVLLLVEQGGDVEWGNPDEVSEIDLIRLFGFL